MQMKHEYDQIVHVHFGQQVLDHGENFLFIVNSEVIKKIIHEYLAQAYSSGHVQYIPFPGGSVCP